MRRPVFWSREALDDIKEQAAHIAKDNPAAARRVADRIRDTGKALGDMAIGRPGRVTGTYEKSLARLPYIIAYVYCGPDLRQLAALIQAAKDSSPVLKLATRSCAPRT